MKLWLLTIISMTAFGCAEVTDTLGITSPKKSASVVRSCYGFYYDANENVYKSGYGGPPISCVEDLNSCQYPLFLNVCSGGDEIIGYNVDAYGQRQFCSNSACSIDDMKRTEHVYPNGITVTCGFSVPSYMQNYVSPREQTCLQNFGVFGSEIGLSSSRGRGGRGYNSSRSYNNTRGYNQRSGYGYDGYTPYQSRRGYW